MFNESFRIIFKTCESKFPRRATDLQLNFLQYTDCSAKANIPNFAKTQSRKTSLRQLSLHTTPSGTSAMACSVICDSVFSSTIESTTPSSEPTGFVSVTLLSKKNPWVPTMALLVHHTLKGFFRPSTTWQGRVVYRYTFKSRRCASCLWNQSCLWIKTKCYISFLLSVLRCVVTCRRSSCHLPKKDSNIQTCCSVYITRNDQIPMYTKTFNKRPMVHITHVVAVYITSFIYNLSKHWEMFSCILIF